MEDIDQARHKLTSSLLSMGRVWRQIAQEAFQIYGISLSNSMALLCLSRLGEGISQITIAEELSIEGPALVRTINQLCLADLIRREKDPNDLRANKLWFTEAGKALTQNIEEELLRLRERVLAPISLAELEITLRVFNTLKQAADPTTRQQGQKKPL